MSISIASDTIWQAGSATLYGRIVGAGNTPITQASLVSVSYTVKDLGTGTVTDPASLTVSSVVYDTLQTADPAWIRDGTGYNLRHTLGPAAFPNPNAYRVVYTFTATDGSVFYAKWDLTAEQTGDAASTPITPASTAAQAANTVYAGPPAGAAANPAFRALLPADLPAAAVQTSGSYADPAWITGLAGSKISGGITGSAAESTGSKLRRLARTALLNNPWARHSMRAVLPWQPSTAYRTSDVVCNGGNLYVATGNGTSAASGGPTITTGAATTDNNFSWLYYGTNVVTADPGSAIGTWAATTAYSLAALVQTAAGRVYACVAAGTSDGTAPTGTTNSVVDGTVTWSYQGTYRPSPHIGDYPVYSTQTTGPSGLTNVYNPQTTLGINSFKLRGCYNGGNFATNFVKGSTFTPAAGAAPIGQHLAYEFYTDAPKLYVFNSSNNQRLGIVIDGVRWSLAPTDFPNGVNTYHVFDFSTSSGRRMRHWRVEALGALNIGQVGVDSSSQVWAPDDCDCVKAVFLSDSLFAGSSYGPFVVGNTVPQRVGHELGWVDCWDFSQGGTGYVNRGSGAGVTTEKFGYRVTEALARNPDVWVLMGSTNDFGQGLSTITAAVTALLQAIRAGGSTAPIVVLGIWPIDDSARAAGDKIADYETAIQAGITAAADPLGTTFFVPLRNDPVLPWVTGSWNNTANTNSISKTQYISGDNTHPPDLGTAYLARRTATAIRSSVLPALK